MNFAGQLPVIAPNITGYNGERSLFAPIGAGGIGATGPTGTNGTSGLSGDIGPTGPPGTIPDPLTVTALNVTTLNSNIPVLYYPNGNSPTASNLFIQGGLQTFDGNGVTTVIFPRPYPSYMYFTLSASGDDSLPDGTLYYTKLRGEADSYTGVNIFSTGLSVNIEFSWISIGW